MAKSTDKKPEPEQQTKDWQTRHLWHIQPVRDVLLVLAVFGVLWFGYVISAVTVPLLLALLLAYLFEPLVCRMVRVKWISRQGAAVAIIAGAIALIVVPLSIALSFAVVQGVGYAGRFATNVTALSDAIEIPIDDAKIDALATEGWRDIARYLVEVKRRRQADDSADDTALDAADSADGSEVLEGVGNDVATVIFWIVNWVEMNSETIGKQALTTGRGAASFALSSAASLGVLAFSGFLTAFFFFFFSTGFAHVVGFWKDLLPTKNKDRIIDLVGKMDGVIAAFVRGRLTIALLQSVVFSLAYWLIGVPAPLMLGIIVAVLSIVPYMALIGVPISIFLLWLEPSGIAWQQEWWWVMGAPLVVYFAIQSLDDYLWTPMIQGKGTDMDTPSIVAASVAGGALAGIYGLLLAIPVAACGKILIRELVWPRIVAWREGEAKDPLPIGEDE